VTNTALLYKQFKRT